MHTVAGALGLGQRPGVHTPHSVQARSFLPVQLSCFYPGLGALRCAVESGAVERSSSLKADVFSCLCSG